MRRISLGLGAAALVLAGCASLETDEPRAVETAQVEQQSETTPTTSVTKTEDGFIEKAVNEEGLGGCSTEELADCDVTFRVTELQRGFTCSAGLTRPIADGHESLLVRLEAEMADSFDFEQSDNLLHYQHWGVIDQDGYYIQSPETLYCPDLDFDLGRLYPGTKARGALLLAVPDGTETLRLGMLRGSGGWEWEIPN